MYVLSVGNPFDGIELWGPFETPDNAISAAEDMGVLDWNVVWNVVELHSPMED